MKKISDATRSTIISLLDDGLSARQIAFRVKVGHSTVNKIRAVYHHTIPKSKGGRKPRLTANDKRHILRIWKSGERENAPQIACQLREDTGKDFSHDTIARALREAGLKAGRKPKKPKLLERHKKTRREWVYTHKNWSETDWERVIWSDETIIERYGDHGKKWIWRKPGESLRDRDVEGKVKYGGGSIMIWGCMTHQGVGFACWVQGRMNSDFYITILEDELLNTMKYYKLNRKKVIFQQDGARPHTTEKVKEWFKKHKIRVLDWPPQSPDLNPIEHLWDHLKRQLAKYPKEPKGVHELWERVQVEWNKIPEDVCFKLVRSMRRRVKAVDKAKGGYTRYQ